MAAQVLCHELATKGADPGVGHGRHSLSVADALGVVGRQKLV